VRADRIAHVVGVGEEQARLDAQHRDAGLRLGVVLALKVHPASVRRAPEHGHIWPRGAVEQEQQ
jgi:hypothetical protein